MGRKDLPVHCCLLLQGVGADCDDEAGVQYPGTGIRQLISTCESIHSPYLRFLLLAEEITGICLNAERNARPS